MYLASLHLLNFKNYEECSAEFSPALNLVTGPNGSGKTNLLDAVYYLCLTKSAFHSTDNLNIRHEQDFMILNGKFIKDDKHVGIQAGLQKGQKKVFKNNKKPYEKISHHIGAFPAVLITPYDTDLIREGSEERRKFFDSILSQTDQEYLNELLKYNKILRQRNALLKSFAEKDFRDLVLLSTYDEPLIESAKVIHKRRKALIEEFIPVFQKHYTELSSEKEEVSLTYKSVVDKKDFKELFGEARQKDLILQRTTRGTHKDDYVFEIAGHPLKAFGSQGQQKSFIIALKLAQFEFIYQHTNIKPILLLDDIFDKLDQQRISKLLEMICEDVFGQIFLTEAGKDRVENFFKNFKREIRTFTIEEGSLKKATGQPE